MPLMPFTETTAEESLQMPEPCQSCGGDGIERCGNPDHGFIGAMGFHDVGRIGCPCCGHDEQHRMRTWKNGKYEWNKCPDCEAKPCS